jgi:hypothetical protein
VRPTNGFALELSPDRGLGDCVGGPAEEVVTRLLFDSGRFATLERALAAWDSDGKLTAAFNK